MTLWRPLAARSGGIRLVELHPHRPAIRAGVHVGHRLDPVVLVRGGGVLDDGDLGVAHRLLGGGLLRRPGALVDVVVAVVLRVDVRTVRREATTDPAVGAEQQQEHPDDDGEAHVADLERQPVEAGSEDDRVDERREQEQRSPTILTVDAVRGLRMAAARSTSATTTETVDSRPVEDMPRTG